MPRTGPDSDPVAASVGSELGAGTVPVPDGTTDPADVSSAYSTEAPVLGSRNASWCAPAARSAGTVNRTLARPCSSVVSTTAASIGVRATSSPSMSVTTSVSCTGAFETSSEESS